MSPQESIGHYRIVAQLGEGGMGAVYRATDTKLGRDVAIKVIHPSVAGDPDRLMRFEREARTLASLNHPNIATLYAVEGPALVMELIEGPTLAERLQFGPVPPQESLAIALQMVDALEAAHEQGIIHRDLKPANIKITPDGQVKLLDFGLAKAFEREMRGADAANSPTITIGTSAAGVLIGTAAYMAPEQARGGKVDRRADIWAFGVVVYEMITGRALFGGESMSDTLAAVLRDPLDLKAVPPRFQNLLRRCLERDIRKRLSWISEARVLLNEEPAVANIAPVPVAAPVPKRRWVTVAAAAALSLTAGFVLFPMLRPEVPDSPDLMLTPFATDPEPEVYPRWSPDGKSIAYVKGGRGNGAIMVRALDNSRPVEVALNGKAPFWSPDGRQVYYITGIGLHTVPASGGESRLVFSNASAADISPDGRTIAVLQGPVLQLSLSSPPGSPLRPFGQKIMGDNSLSWYDFLRFSHDGRRIFVQATSGVVADLDAKSPLRVLYRGMRMFPGAAWTPGDDALILPSRQAVGRPSNIQTIDSRTGAARRLMRGTIEQILGADLSPDGKRLALTIGESDYDAVTIPLDGSPVRPLAATPREELRPNWLPSQNALVYITNRGGTYDIIAKDLGGVWERTLVHDIKGNPRYFGLRVSPDGKRMVYDSNRREFLVAPTAGGTPISVFRSTTDEVHHRPDWSPDGNWLVFDGLRNGQRRLLKLHVGANQPPEEITHGISPMHNRWSPDGAWILYHSTGKGLALISPDGKQQRALLRAPSLTCTAWSADSKSVVMVIRDAAGGHVILRADIATGAQTKLAQLPDGVVLDSEDTCGDLSPDGKSIAATVVRFTSDIWIADGLQLSSRWWERLFARGKDSQQIASDEIEEDRQQ